MNETAVTNLQQVWDSVLTEIELDVPPTTFNTWFKDTFVLREESGVVVVGVPNEFVRSWLTEKYYKQVLRMLRDKSEHIRNVEYVVSKDKKQQRVSQFPQTTTSALSLTASVDRTNNLNPRYTFDTFVVGSFNDLAHAAAQSVVSNPGIGYNPFFVYGKTGCGKTHLIQAVGNHIKEKRPDTKVYYLTSEKFAVDYINSIKSNKVNAFKERYRRYDVLIMDDIQFLSKKEKTQEELFHLFNTLYNNNKQIIFSSDVHPNRLPDIQERVRSRLNVGMTIDIQQPDQESRMAILENKIKQSQVPIQDEVVEFLANSIESNIRELEGALNTIVCQTQLKKRVLKTSEVKVLIRNNIRSRQTVPIEDVVRIIADYYGVDEESIYKKTRKKEVVRPRQVVMYLLREDYNIPYPTIGQKIGGRDHTTVIHSYEKIKGELEHDNVLAQEIQHVRSLL